MANLNLSKFHMWPRREVEVSRLYRGSTRLHNPILVHDLRLNFRGACVANRQVTFYYSVELTRYHNTTQQQEQTKFHSYLEIILDIN